MKASDYKGRRHVYVRKANFLSDECTRHSRHDDAGVFKAGHYVLCVLRPRWVDYLQWLI